MKEMVGIADAHGLESFLPVEGNEETMFMLSIRASANRHRHAVVYKVKVDKEAEKAVNEQIKKNDFIKALKVLKENAVDVELMRGQGNVEKSWGMIPNPKLDPWS